MVEHWAFNLMVAGSSPATPRLDTYSNYMITKESVFQRSLRFGPVVLKGPSIVARLCSQIARPLAPTSRLNIIYSKARSPNRPDRSEGESFSAPSLEVPSYRAKIGAAFLFENVRKAKKKNSSFRTFPIKTGQRSRTQRRDFNEEMKKGP